MTQVTVERRYVLSASSLTTAATQPGKVTDKIKSLADAGRIFLTVLSIEQSKDGAFLADLRGRCQRTTARVEELTSDLREILRPPCGQLLLGNDPDLESDEAWLLALARREMCTIVCEPSPLGQLSAVAVRLGYRLIDLSLLMAES